MTLEEAKEYKVASVACKSSLLLHTQWFFLERENRKFVTNEHHIKICNVLEAVLRGELTKVIINIAPRYSKTDLAVKNFVSHALSLNPSSKFIHLSYSDDLALDNSEAIKDIVNFPSYQAMFPGVEIKKGSDSKKKWYTTAGGGVYATSAAGQVTGFGAGKVDKEDEELGEFFNEIEVKQGFAGALIIDDPVKPEEADSEVRRTRINERFDSTLRNRVNSRKTPIIIIMQRLHEQDLCGYLMEEEGFVTTIEEAQADPSKWFVLSLPVIQTDADGIESALWPFKHTLDELKAMQERMPLVFGRQYMMNPMPKEGLMYSEFKTYQAIPISKKMVKKAYVDTADTGTDYTCSITYIETETACYVTDVAYTQAAMETAEPLVTMQLAKQEVQRALFESNNGGKGFARNVESGLRILNNKSTKVEWFHQSENKEVRIFTKSADVNNMVYMPEGWDRLWPKFYKDVTQHLANGKSKHDDAADVLTGITEDFGKGIFKSNAAILGNFR